MFYNMILDSARVVSLSNITLCHNIFFADWKQQRLALNAFEIVTIRRWR
jgi:hypothetical protein